MIQDAVVTIRLATPADIDTLTSLHLDLTALRLFWPRRPSAGPSGRAVHQGHVPLASQQRRSVHAHC